MIERIYVPQVRSQVDTEDGGEAPGLDCEDERREPDEDTDVGHDDLAVLVRLEDHGVGVEVYVRGQRESRKLTLYDIRLVHAG